MKGSPLWLIQALVGSIGLVIGNIAWITAMMPHVNHGHAPSTLGAIGLYLLLALLDALVGTLVLTCWEFAIWDQ